MMDLEDLPEQLLLFCSLTAKKKTEHLDKISKLVGVACSSGNAITIAWVRDKITRTHEEILANSHSYNEHKSTVDWASVQIMENLSALENVLNGALEQIDHVKARELRRG